MRLPGSTVFADRICVAPPLLSECNVCSKRKAVLSSPTTVWSSSRRSASKTRTRSPSCCTLSTWPLQAWLSMLRTDWAGGIFSWERRVSWPPACMRLLVSLASPAIRKASRALSLAYSSGSLRRLWDGLHGTCSASLCTPDFPLTSHQRLDRNSRNPHPPTPRKDNHYRHL